MAGDVEPVEKATVLNLTFLIYVHFISGLKRTNKMGTRALICLQITNISIKSFTEQVGLPKFNNNNEICHYMPSESVPKVRGIMRFL